MKFSVLALDYDGTIAREGKLDPNVRSAIEQARARGIVVILVTGRFLSDLRRVTGDLDAFDAVVAENGAVLSFPGGWTRVLGGSPPPAFLDELCRQKVRFDMGECVVETDATAASRLLAAVQTLECPLVLAFNRSRVMLLPQGISKATGLREALGTLRLSLHNCIGIGDAENDYQLLDACEIGVAVGWGSKSLREVADEVLPGKGPEAVADYIRKVIGRTSLPRSQAAHRRVLLGQASDGHPLEMAIHGRILLIAGDPRSGKSWVTGLFCEQLILQGYCLCIIDPEGDYAPLEALPNVVLFGGDEPPPRLSDVARALRYPDVSVIIDLSQATHSEKETYLRALLPMLAGLRGDTGQPHWIVVDEAHYFLNEPDFRQQMDLELGGYMLVTYRVSNLYPDLLKEIESIVVTQITDAREAQLLAKMYGHPDDVSQWASLLSGLTMDEAAVLPQVDAPERTLRKFIVAARLTPHVRHRSKYLEVPMHENHAFIFTCNDTPFGNAARTLKEFVTLLERAPDASLEGHARRGDFSRWIAEVFGDQPLAAALRKVERRVRSGDLANVRVALIAPIRERYEDGLIDVGMALWEMARHERISAPASPEALVVTSTRPGELSIYRGASSDHSPARRRGRKPYAKRPVPRPHRTLLHRGVKWTHSGGVRAVWCESGPARGRRPEFLAPVVHGVHSAAYSRSQARRCLAFRPRCRRGERRAASGSRLN